MKTLQQFLQIAERYYKPDEKLSSGKTPYEKASASSDRQTEKYYSKPENERSLKDIRRLAKQNKRINQNVRHGADNPNFNLHWDPSGEVQVSGHSDDRMRVKNPKSNISFVISNTGKKTKEGKPVHDVDWYNTGKAGDEMDDKEKKNTLRSAKDTWTKHISHRLPYGSVIRNFPISNPGSKSSSGKRYARASLYSRIAGFGERNPRTGYQYASVDREPSPRQKAKGKKKTNPMSPDTATFDSLPEEFRDLSPEKEEKVKNRVGELARDLQVQSARMKELKKKPFGKYRPKVKKEKEAIVKSAKKKQRQVQNASDALIRTSISREAKKRREYEDIKQKLRDLGVDP